MIGRRMRLVIDLASAEHQFPSKKSRPTAALLDEDSFNWSGSAER